MVQNHAHGSEARLLFLILRKKPWQVLTGLSKKVRIIFETTYCNFQHIKLIGLVIVKPDRLPWNAQDF